MRASIARIRKSLGLETNIIVLLAAIVLMGLGEELWSDFVPKVLEALGAGAIVWTAYRSLRDLLDALYQVPGGVAVDRLGSRGALVLLNLIAVAGYVIYLLGGHWAWILVGTLFVAAWGSMAMPATFAVVAEGLQKGRRGVGFGVQSALKRLPIVVAPVAGGALMARLGVIPGFRTAMALTIGLALVSLGLQQVFYTRRPMELARPAVRAEGALAGLGPGLRRLLLSDVLARCAEGIPSALVVVYATTHLGASLALYGALRGLQMLTSIVSYLPGGLLADRWGPRLLIGLTFGFFALFPLAFALHPLVPSVPLSLFLGAASVLAGLREIGEPARKALIVDLAEPSRRGETVGAYYLVRGLAVAPAPLLGGALWSVSPQLAFAVAAVAGAAALGLFLWRGPGDPAKEG